MRNSWCVRCWRRSSWWLRSPHVTQVESGDEGEECGVIIIPLGVIVVSSHCSRRREKEGKVRSDKRKISWQMEYLEGGRTERKDHQNQNHQNGNQKAG
jgi:hypothetical protein